MWGSSTPLNTAWCCLAFASGCSVSSMCSPLWALNILCRSVAMQGAYMCAGLNWSLSSFPFSTLFCLQSSSFPFHFSFPGGRQDNDDDASSTNGSCWDSDFGCKGDFMGILHFTYQPSWKKKTKRITHFHWSAFFPRDHCWNSSCPVISAYQPVFGFCPPIPQHLPQSIKAVWLLFIDFSEFQKNINMKVISCELWKMLHQLGF